VPLHIFLHTCPRRGISGETSKTLRKPKKMGQGFLKVYYVRHREAFFAEAISPSGHKIASLACLRQYRRYRWPPGQAGRKYAGLRNDIS
jgi:hypothetical protein